MKFGNYCVILFDWGGTLMLDDPTQKTTMALWPQVESIPDVDLLLEYLISNRFRLGLATGAAVSNENDIRQALARVKFDQYFEKVYCFKNTGHQKPSSKFYQTILDDLSLQPQDVLMVGDSFKNDVLAANHIGIPAVWYNPLTVESRDGILFLTVHSMSELLAKFQTSTNAGIISSEVS